LPGHRGDVRTAALRIAVADAASVAKCAITEAGGQPGEFRIGTLFYPRRRDLAPRYRR